MRGQCCQGWQYGASDHHHPILDPTKSNILFNEVDSLDIAVDENRTGGPAAEGFQAEGARSGKEIQHLGAGNPGGDDIEDGFPDAIGRGSDVAPLGS